ncbi:hypothetical protein B0H34DRAFT_706900 [Crassisporium funariophilum]|nr:hypothetical protein B0H34DRAFT_706900 [Crassisporium funariophilum]
MNCERQLKAASEAFFDAFSSNTTPINLLSYFSTTCPIILQHAPANCPHPHTSRLVGGNALRSYFDLLATHWSRSDAKIRHAPQADADTRSVVLGASITWMWRKSGRKWTEDFTWTLEFDDALKIVSFVARTVSGPGTCVMRAVDHEPAMQDRASTHWQASM